jgi:DNA-directed RNA polymerase specialized sigma24 family protein
MSSDEDISWPTDPSALARIAVQTSSPAERNRALAGLRPAIERAAVQAGVDLDRQQRQDLLDDAAHVIWERLPRYQPREGVSFEAWAAQVLYHWAISNYHRKLARDALGHTSIASADPEAVAQPATAHPRSEPEELRHWLDRAARPGRKVDYFAVFLLYLRLAVVERLRQTWVPEAGLPPGAMSAAVVEVLPWRPAEEQRRLRADLPCLAEVWASLQDALDRPPYTATTGELCRVLSWLAGRPGAVTIEVWYQWTCRARHEARARIPAADWERLIASWLPRRPSGSEP